MADERYQWLDQEAAERLLRGEPVDPVGLPDEASRAQAELLARTLGAARTPAAALGPDGELPGEAAALAAFRKVSAERAAEAAAAAYAVSAAPAATPPAAPELGTVRIAPAPAGHRWGRSLRYGLAAALAAVTVGGVAVAAGTGMLPLTREPAPRSVTAAGTPDGSGSSGPAVLGSPSGGTGPAIPSVPLDRESGTPTPGTSGGPPTATGGTGGHDGTGASPTPGESGKTGGEDAERRKTLKACREYQDGTLADSGRQRLLGALRNGETVKRYCTRVLSGTPGTGSTATGRTPSGDGKGNGGSNGGSGSGGSGGSDDDKGDRGGDKHHPDAPGKPGAKPGKGDDKGGGKGHEKPGRDRSPTQV
ncbi:hypothetical protein [Streptomyces showdoensis]|uniref:hypothetical protein n=1 Tax=Streptomyces showdoensis TaxID=68268 RepID=UPI000F4F5AD2|nr:hypothetical protein [Streptomyces showdoensis]